MAAGERRAKKKTRQRSGSQDCYYIERRQKIADLYLAGMAQEDIAERLKMSGRMVSYELKRAREIWRERTAQAYNDWLDEETARIERLYREAWEAWEKSKKPRDFVSKKTGELVRIEPPGDPRFLERMEKLLVLAARIRGALGGDVNINLRGAEEKGYVWDELFPKNDPKTVNARVIEHKPLTNGHSE